MAVHPAWWAAACACDGVKWMHVCGTACSHLCEQVAPIRLEMATDQGGWVHVCICFAEQWLWWSMATWLERSKSTGVAGGGAARACSAAPDACVHVSLRIWLFALPLGWHFNQASSMWLERAAHPWGWVQACVCASRRWLGGYMVGAFKVYRRCWRRRCAGVCTAPNTCVHVDAPVVLPLGWHFNQAASLLLAVWSAVLMCWRYSFRSSEGGLSSLSSPCSVKGLSVLHLVAQQAFKGATGPRGVRRSPHWWYSCSGIHTEGV